MATNFTNLNNLIDMSVNENTVNEITINEITINESNVESQAYTKAFKQQQYKDKSISKGKSNNNGANKSNIKGKNKSNRKGNKKTKDNNKTVKNVSRTKIIRKIKERKTDNRRTQASMYKNERLNSYYDPVKNDIIDADDEDAMNEIWDCFENNKTDDDRFLEDNYICFG